MFATNALVYPSQLSSSGVVGSSSADFGVHELKSGSGTGVIGGVQLALEPRRAQVFVDGLYAGLVDDFAGYYRHLPLPAGNHRIEVFAPGYQPLIFDVTVVPDRTITYRQSLVSGVW